MTKVLIASPVRQKPIILKEFLDSLVKLETGNLDTDFLFIDDNETPSEWLTQFRARTGEQRVTILPGNGGEEYLRDELTHHWRSRLIWKVAAYKDRFIAAAKERGSDFLLLADSDLVLHPKTLVHLVLLNLDIVSEVFWTRWNPELPPLPQVWLGDQYRLFPKAADETISEEEAGRRTAEFLSMLRQPGTYKVGGLGACTLISRRALLAGVSFREIYNLGLTGEDRHFCIRAAALGFELFADTHYPPYHIYRESELSGVAEYLRRIDSTKGLPTSVRPVPGFISGNGLTLAMLVRNEAGRFLEPVLAQARQYVERVVIVDDASEDPTVSICQKALAGIPLSLVSNPAPAFHNEIILRRQLWSMAIATQPQWILILDADELFEERAVTELPRLLNDASVDVYTFRLFDFWNETHYREDRYWQAHRTYRPFLVRYRPDFDYQWQETPQHCGRFPRNILELRVAANPLRIKHLGWSRPADRVAKFRRYRELDPEGRYGVLEQYRSILAPRPHLIPWHEQE
jgi:glycosyltransferase involved in cell wall biosynthesis